MHQPFHENFSDFFAYFNGNADYFECHEVLEELWKEVAPGNKQHVLVGFIQIATALYHWRRENFKGAAKSMRKGIDIVKNVNEDESYYTKAIQLDTFLTSAEQALQLISNQQPFQPFQITITNAELQKIVDNKIKQLPAHNANYLLNKHTLRDRTSVIAERARSLRLKDARRK